MRIPFDLRDCGNKVKTSFDFDFDFTDEEKNYLKNYDSMDYCVVYVDVINSNSIVNLNINVEASLYLIDAHNLKKVNYELNDKVSIVINLNSDEDSDILPDNDGIYDLRPVVIALLYNAIPKNYSTVELKKVVTDSYTIMSQAEYEDSKNNSPFDCLDSSDFE